MSRAFLVALDSFKGSVGSVEAGRAVRDGILAGAPRASCQVIGMGDGGEGTLDVIASHEEGRLHETSVRDLNGDVCAARWFLGANGEAFIEMAQVAGLPNARVPARERTTHGVGELILAALGAGAKRCVVGCGGSGTVECGRGMLEAIAGGRGTLDEQIRAARRRLGDMALTAATDVENPLAGPRGAIEFARQKGVAQADLPSLLVEIDAVADALDGVVRAYGEPPVSARPGAGAAGGIAGMICALGGAVCSGFDHVAAAVGLLRAVAEADWVVTGEGRVDATTGRGKLVARVLALAPGRTFVVAGWATERGAGAAVAAGACDVLSLCDGSPEDTQSSISDPVPRLRHAGRRLVSLAADPTGAA